MNNALNYGGNVTVSLTSKPPFPSLYNQKDKHIFILIEDDGPGLKQENLEYVLNPLSVWKQAATVLQEGLDWDFQSQEILFADKVEILLYIIVFLMDYVQSLCL